MAQGDDVINGAFVLNGLSKAIKFRRHAIVGIYGKQRPFVRHAALLKGDQEVDGERPLPLNHMGPPLHNDGLTPCQLVAQIDLTNEDIEAIDDWLAEVSTQYREVNVLPLQQYVICPHMKWVHSEEGVRIRQRFSCVGYVVEAYRAADIALIDCETVPPATKEMLEKAYPEFERIGQSPGLSEKLGFVSFDDLGVPGDGPWRIALAGYLFHAIHRHSKHEERSIAFAPSGVGQSNYPMLM